jgi:hypothetical protein
MRILFIESNTVFKRIIGNSFFFRHYWRGIFFAKKDGNEENIIMELLIFLLIKKQIG